MSSLLTLQCARMNGVTMLDEVAGYNLRSKSVAVKDGGVVAGNAVLDSVLLME